LDLRVSQRIQNISEMPFEHDEKKSIEDIGNLELDNLKLETSSKKFSKNFSKSDPYDEDLIGKKEVELKSDRSEEVDEDSYSEIEDSSDISSEEGITKDFLSLADFNARFQAATETIHSFTSQR
jgi:hypothetical protein